MLGRDTDLRSLKNKRVDQAHFWGKNSIKQIIAHSKELVELIRLILVSSDTARRVLYPKTD